MKYASFSKVAMAGLLAGGALLSTSALAVPDQPKNWEKCDPSRHLLYTITMILTALVEVEEEGCLQH